MDTLWAGVLQGGRAHLQPVDYTDSLQWQVHTFCAFCLMICCTSSTSTLASSPARSTLPVVSGATCRTPTPHRWFCCAGWLCWWSEVTASARTPDKSEGSLVATHSPQHERDLWRQQTWTVRMTHEVN